MTTNTLWLDSSIIRMGPTKLRILVELAEEKHIQVVVHPHIHLEYCRFRRECRPRSFEQSFIDEYFAELGIVVVDFTLSKQTAERWAEILHARYPTKEAWQNAKLSSVCARLPEEAKAKADDVTMTTDWWVALEVEHKNGYIAVEDKGDEWSALRQMQPCRAFSYDACLQWLRDQTPIL